MYPEIKDGDYFEAEHVKHGKVEGRISVEDGYGEANRVLLCQDVEGFFDCRDRKGYEYVMHIGSIDDFSPNRNGFKNFRIIKRADGTEVPNVGEIWEHKNSKEKFKILFVQDNMVLRSYFDNYEICNSTTYALDEISSMHKRISPEPAEEVVELTIDEIAEKFGKDPSKIRVKKEG